MGLATPTSIMVGTGRAAEMGVLFRQGDALQTLRDVQVVAFDKTGTLTLGKPTLTELEPAAGVDEREVLQWVASVQARSEHPIALAIVAAAVERKIDLLPAEGFAAITGAGVEASVAGKRVLAGADRLMAERGIDVSAFGQRAEQWGNEGKTPIYVAIDGQAAAMMAVTDPVKPSAVDAIAALHAQGLKTAMITGDNRHTAQAVARQLGIDEVRAEVLPDGKVEAIAALRAGGRKLAFVGDGINDAPALAAADTGIAIGTGTDVAIEAASVVLMADDLHGVPNAIALSRATLANIRQNLFWAFAYNAALIPLAAGALYPAYGLSLSPIFAAGAMALSSVFVLGNALRLKTFRPRAPRTDAPFFQETAYEYRTSRPGIRHLGQDDPLLREHRPDRPGAAQGLGLPGLQRARPAHAALRAARARPGFLGRTDERAAGAVARPQPRQRRRQAHRARTRGRTGTQGLRPARHGGHAQAPGAQLPRG